jgi:uncharacterized protein (TIGR03790 family)
MIWRAARWLAWLGCLVTVRGAAPVVEELLAARVVVLANSEDPDSLRIARHYAEARGVPAANIVALRMPLTEVVSWGEFVTTVWSPLLAQLVRDGWIDAIPMNLTDLVGRKKYYVNGHRIAALVTCRGVPLKIADNRDLYAEVLPFTRHSEFRVNCGAVDAELSLLPVPNYPINAFIPNPLFQNERPSPNDLRQIVKVSRLDGPSVDDALALVDRALAAERHGLLGRAYVDIANRDPVGDPWLEATANQLQDLGFDTSVDREGATMPATARIDVPVLYFGWYASDVDGPFNLPGFRFPPGAIVQHIHSFSASTMRLSNSGWTGPFVARGATATVGNVYEPYLTFSHRPNLLLKALARGWTLVDAGYYALQALSWQEVLIGDPLYRPFAVSLDDQMARLTKLPPALAGYAVLRQMHRLDATKREAEGTALAVSAQHAVPSLAVGLALAQRLRAAGDPDAAANALGFAPLLKKFPADEWAVAREAALLLESCSRPTRALDVWRTLLADEAMPRELRLPWLRDAIRCARGAKDEAQASAWEKAIGEWERK